MIKKDIENKQYIIFDMKRVHLVDFTAAHTLELIARAINEKGGKLIFSRVPVKLPTGQDIEEYFNELGVIKNKNSTKIFFELEDAIEFVEDLIIKKYGKEPDNSTPLLLEEFELLAGRKDTIIDDLKQHIKEASFKNGEFIFKSDDESSDFYLIRNGVIKIMLPISDGKSINISTLGRGAFFGEFSFLDHIPRTANAVASGDVELYILTQEAFDNFMHTHKKSAILFLRGLIRSLVKRLQNTNAQLGNLID
jgi:sulfate permease, SulP family